MPPDTHPSKSSRALELSEMTAQDWADYNQWEREAFPEAPMLKLYRINPRVGVCFTVLALSKRDAASLVISKHGVGALGDGEFEEIRMQPGIVAEAWE